jgi:hypothetical protein
MLGHEISKMGNDTILQHRLAGNSKTSFSSEQVNANPQSYNRDACAVVTSEY